MRIKPFPSEWSLFCSKSSYLELTWWKEILKLTDENFLGLFLSIWTTTGHLEAPLEACPQSKISHVNFVSPLGNKVVSLIEELVILFVDTFFPLPHLLAALLRIGYMIVYASKCVSWYVLWHCALLYTLLFLLTPSLFKITGLSCGPKSGWESISDFCFSNLNV